MSFFTVVFVCMCVKAAQPVHVSEGLNFHSSLGGCAHFFMHSHTQAARENEEKRKALYDIMSCMRDVRKRTDRTDQMFEPLRDTVALLHRCVLHDCGKAHSGKFDTHARARSGKFDVFVRLIMMSLCLLSISLPWSNECA